MNIRYPIYEGVYRILTFEDIILEKEGKGDFPSPPRFLFKRLSRY